MTLFDTNTSLIINDNQSQVIYQSEFLDTEESQELYQYLLNNLDWQCDSAKIFGKTIITKRKIVWMSDSGLDYNYSGSSRIGNGIWDAEVANIKNKLEQQTGFGFNSCLLNLYHNGKEGMGWHSDDQNHLDQNHTAVAIISLGTERFFKLRQNQNPTCNHKILLESGSLLIMLGKTQKHCQHEIPKMAGVKTPRISLTFRTMQSSDKNLLFNQKNQLLN